MSGFGRYHPLVLLVYFLSVLLIGMFLTNPLLRLLALFGSGCFCISLVPKRELPGLFGFYLALLFLIAVTNPLFSHNGVTPLFFMNGNPVTLEACIYGISIAVMLVGVMLWCKCYSILMTSDKFVYLFGRAMPKLSLVLSMALRFIPVMKRQMHAADRAQKAMGLYVSDSFVDRLRSRIHVLSAILSWSFENAMDTAASMQARGYGLKGRTQFSLFRFTKRDGVLLGADVILLALVLAGTAAGDTAFAYYPRMSAWDPTPLAILSYIAFGVLSFLPFLIEVKEKLVWKYYRSKI